MASNPAPDQRGNLLLTLPPELRNEIYALDITTDFFELDPTISAKEYPRARYGIFDIQRGIKAQGGTPAIAQTCREIRTEALDVYLGSNTFALIGEDSTLAKNTSAIANRIAAHEWIQLIGDDAKYLRKVRLSLGNTNGWSYFLANFLISVISNSNGKAPRVVCIPSSRRIDSNSAMAKQAMYLESAIQDLLAKTNDMAKVWRAVAERALYPALDDSGNFGFDISEDAIAKIAKDFPLKRTKASTRKNGSSNVYQASHEKVDVSTTPKANTKKPASSKRTQAARKKVETRLRTVEPSHDSDCMIIEAPAGAAKSSIKRKGPSKRGTEAASVSFPKANQEEDYDVLEVEAPVKKPQARKKAQKIAPAKVVQEASMSDESQRQAIESSPNPQRVTPIMEVEALGKEQQPVNKLIDAKEDGNAAPYDYTTRRGGRYGSEGNHSSQYEEETTAEILRLR